MTLQVEKSDDRKSVKLNWSRYIGWGNNLKYQIWRQIPGRPAQLLTGTPDTTVTLATATDAFEQLYYIVAEHPNGWKTYSNRQQIHFQNPLIFYNVITPNNDGRNDVFVIENLHLYPQTSLSIFNRWSQEVFNSKNYDNRWNGGDLAPGTYFYLSITATGVKYKGWFEIIK